MAITVLKTIEDCEDLLEGALWMGTGGGGSYQEGIDLLGKVINEGLSPAWVDPEVIADGVWTVTIGLHGSIAPLTPETLKEIQDQELTEATDEWYLIKAVKELGQALGYEFGCIVPAELGPDSVAIPLAVGARLGIPVVDGDYIGRAVPEETQSTYCLYGKNSHLFAGADRWGNTVFVKNAVNTHALERMAKMLAVASYGDIAVATTPLPARDMKEIIVSGTLTKCFDIGKTLRKARDNGSDPINAGVALVNGWRLFDGIISRLETEDRDGYYFGTVFVDGTGVNFGQKLEVWFKNENQITWMNGKPWICSPDLVTFLDSKSGTGIYNSALKEGDEITAVGMKGVEGFRSEAGLKLAGPRHFGFDIEYIPIEDQMKDRGVG